LLLIPDIFVTAQTVLYHCTITSCHCTFCVSLHSILCPALQRVEFWPTTLSLALHSVISVMTLLITLVLFA